MRAKLMNGITIMKENVGIEYEYFLQMLGACISS